MHQTKAVFSQEMHCCGDPDENVAELALELMDGGAGEYLVFKAKHWSFDEGAEGCAQIDELASVMKKMLSTAKGKTK